MVSIVILAAGSSQRMGAKNKLLLPFKGKALFLHAVDACLDSAANECILVSGHESAAITKSLDNRKLNIIHNPNFQTGMTGSIQIGIRNCSPNSTAYLICLSDMPFVTANDINQLIRHFSRFRSEQSKPSIIMAKCAGNKSHPILFSAEFKTEILNHENPNGCKEVIQKNEKHVQYCSFSHDFSVDIDDEESYLKWNGF